jgi:carboxymethylenebutenolidase
MERKKASDFPPEVLKLFDGYVHGGISRREFLEVPDAPWRVSAAAMLRRSAPASRVPGGR